MTTFPSPCSIDANILVDCDIGAVLDEIFRLPTLILATDLILREVEPMLSVSLQQLRAFGLETRTLTGEQVAILYRLRQEEPQARRVSVADLSAMLVAETERGVLLTGDGPLRDFATERGRSVHGTLWLLDSMLDHEVQTPAQLVRALETMLRSDRRLPGDECQRRLSHWHRL